MDSPFHSCNIKPLLRSGSAPVAQGEPGDILGLLAALPHPEATAGGRAPTSVQELRDLCLFLRGRRLLPGEGEQENGPLYV